MAKTGPSAQFVYAFRKILRPLVGILIKAGVTYEEFSQVIKGVYVEAGIRDGLGKPGPVTRSRVSIVTGVGRRDVDRFIDDESLLSTPPKTNLAAITEVVHRWHTDSAYLGPYGVPLEIDFNETRNRCFADLVRSVDEHLDPVEALDELLQSGVLARSGDRHFKVTTRLVMSREPLSPQALEHFGKVLTALAATLNYNLDAQNTDKRIERSVFADRGLTRMQLADFEQYAKAKVSELIVDVDNWFANVQPAPGTPACEVVDVGINIFQFVSPRTTEKPLGELVGS